MKAEKKDTEMQALILRIRGGEEIAFRELMEIYTPLVQAEVARNSGDLGSFDRDDLLQAAWLALYRAALSFDLDQSEVSFGLYAKVCISNALSTQLRALLRRYTVEVPLEQAINEAQGDEGDDPARRIREEEDLQLLRTRIRTLLSPFENRVWSLYTAGLSAKEIGARLEKQPRSIENAVYRIRQKLRTGLAQGDK
ncbi:MAG: sigma-70 family RNA polymerase sigma factor [Clostridia bacterium]|nr:sigma-70 family RNA polymerase sigma factor [Clostridia bacterium]